MREVLDALLAVLSKLTAHHSPRPARECAAPAGWDFFEFSII
jgi:hypothetical protein